MDVEVLVSYTAEEDDQIEPAGSVSASDGQMGGR